VVAYIPKMPR